MFDGKASSSQDCRQSLKAECPARWGDECLARACSGFRNVQRFELLDIRYHRPEEPHGVNDQPKNIYDNSNTTACLHTARFDIGVDELDLWGIFSRKGYGLTVAVDTYEPSISYLK
jgi:hypothetical protein